MGFKRKVLWLCIANGARFIAWSSTDRYDTVFNIHARKIRYDPLNQVFQTSKPSGIIFKEKAVGSVSYFNAPF
jgi:hypothetical protein